MQGAKRIKIGVICSIAAFFYSQFAFAAANFSIVPYGTLPTSVVTGQSVSAMFTVTNLTHTARNGYTLAGLPNTVTQDTTSPNCSNPINLNPGASCQLSLIIKGAVSANFAICKGHSCTTATTPLNVKVQTTQPSRTALYVFITTTDATSKGSVLSCPLDENGSFTISSCKNADVNGDLDSAYPQGIVINSAGTTAFISSEGNSTHAYQCSINPTTKLFDGCTSTEITTGDYYYTLYGMLGLSKDESEVFIANYADAEELSITRCPVVNNVIDDNCVSSAKLSSSSSSYGLGVAVNATTVFASTYSDSNLAICPIAGWGSACTLISGVRVAQSDIDFSNPTGVAINSDNTVLYIGTETEPHVYGCNPTAITGGTRLSNCFEATQFDGSSGIWSMILNSKNTDAYYTGDFNGILYHCKVEKDGTIPFSGCDKITGFANGSSPIGMALLY